MRITLDLDGDVLIAAKQLALQRSATTGQIISELARQALAPIGSPMMRNGVPLFTPRPGKKKPGLAVVNQLRDKL